MSNKPIYFISIFLFFSFWNLNYSIADNGELLLGKKDSKVTVKVFSSLTCPHCANFHKNIFKKLEKEYFNSVRFEHHGFPLDMAALNAEKVLGCFESKQKKINFLNELYEKQDSWASGSDINSINTNLIKIGNKHGLNNDMIKKCLEDEKIEDKILNARIMAQKEYSIESTPTIFINDKEYTGKHNYEEFRKIIEIENK